MKKIFKSLIVLAVIAGFTSCEDEKDLMFLSPQSEFRILTPATGESVVLDPATPSNPGLSISWEALDYGTPTDVTYEVQVAKNGTDFATPIVVASTTNTYASINSEALNGTAIAAGLESDEVGTLDIRVRAYVGNGSEEAFSDTITYSVTPYVTYPYLDLYLVGNASQDNWNNNSNNYPLFRDAANENHYSYTGYFNAGSFKLLEVKGQWQPQWGQNGGTLAVNDGTGSDPGTFDIASAGYYTFDVDVAANTYSITPYDASGATTFSTMGIIGTATPNDWNDPDTDMVQSTFDPHKWYILNQFLKANKEMKFRANDGWTNNWGGNTPYSGVATQDGPNIPTTIPIDGNYDIWFDDLTGRYIYIPVE